MLWTLWRRFESATLKLGRDVKHFNFANRDVCKSCVIYKGDGSCGSRYIGEIKRNAEVRWNEDNNPTKSLKPSKHLRSNINHYLHSLSFQMFQKMLRPGTTCSLET